MKVSLLLSSELGKIKLSWCFRDGLTHFGGGHLTRQQLQTLQNVTDLLRHTFVSQFVFPVLGREDSPDPVRRSKHNDKGYRELADLWRHWLPTEAIQTFTKGKTCIIHFLFILDMTINLLSNNSPSASATSYSSHFGFPSFIRPGFHSHILGGQHENLLFFHSRLPHFFLIPD